MNRLSLLLPSIERKPTVKASSTTPIFGLRYLEEEATDLYDVVGCLRYNDPVEPATQYQSGCDVDLD